MLALRNASPSSQTATVTVQYTVGGQLQSRSLSTINLAAHEVRMVNFSALLNSLRNLSVEDAGLKIEPSSEAPGSLIAQLTSVDETKTMCVDVPLSAVAPNFVGTGAHPFRLDEDFQAVLHLKNLGSKRTAAIVQIVFDDGEFTPELVRLGPGESVAIDVRQVRNSQAKDIHGHKLPVYLSSGQVHWFQHGKESVIGHLVSFSPSLGVSANFACENGCCPADYYSSSVSPSLVFGVPDNSFNVIVTEVDRSLCTGQLYGPFDITADSSISSSDPTVAQVFGNTVILVSAGSAYIFADHTATSCTAQQDPDCIPPEPFTCGTCNTGCRTFCMADDFPVTDSALVVVQPVIDSITPSRALIGTSVDVAITGKGFTADSFIVVEGNGFSALITSKSSTKLIARFDISLNADPGNHNVSVVSNNQSSNKVGFFVQVPSSLSVLSVTYVANWNIR